MEKSGYPPEVPSSQPPPYYPAAYPTQPAAAPQPQVYVHQQQPMIQVVQMANLSSESTRMTCPHCRAEISTKVTYQTSCMTHLAAAVLCLLGCWPCVCIPYCTDACMDAEHECPNCNKFLGHYRRWRLICHERNVRWLQKFIPKRFWHSNSKFMQMVNFSIFFIVS